MIPREKKDDENAGSGDAVDLDEDDALVDEPTLENVPPVAAEVVAGDAQLEHDTKSGMYHQHASRRCESNRFESNFANRF